MDEVLGFLMLAVLVIGVMRASESLKQIVWGKKAPKSSSSESFRKGTDDQWESLDVEEIRAALLSKGWLSESGHLKAGAPEKIFVGSSAIVRELVEGADANTAGRSQKLMDVATEFSAYLVSLMTQRTLLNLVPYAVRGGSGDAVVVAILRKVLDTNRYVSNPGVLKVDLGLEDEEYSSLPLTFIERADRAHSEQTREKIAKAEVEEKAKAEKKAADLRAKAEAEERGQRVVGEAATGKKKAEQARERLAWYEEQAEWKNVSKPRNEWRRREPE